MTARAYRMRKALNLIPGAPGSLSSGGFQAIDIPDGMVDSAPISSLFGDEKAVSISAIEKHVAAVAADLHNEYRRQPVGDAWFDNRHAVAARVPSAIVPQEYNVLVNPLHSGIQDVRSSWEPFKIDPRLFEVKRGRRA